MPCSPPPRHRCFLGARQAHRSRTWKPEREFFLKKKINLCIYRNREPGERVETEAFLPLALSLSLFLNFFL